MNRCHYWRLFTGAVKKSLKHTGMARSRGVPDLKFLVMPHLIAKLTPEHLDRRAVDIAPQVVDLLLKGQQGA